MTTRPPRSGLNARRAAALLGSLGIAACASTPPPPTAALNAAHTAIAEAERVDAGHYAGGELTEARSKLTLADGNVASGQMAAAERYATESRVEAELATATTGALKAQAVNANMQKSNSNMIEEMQRNAGDAQ